MTMQGRIARRALLAGLVAAAPCHALGRKPFGGTLRLVIPWSLLRIDPHDLDDPIAALFGTLIADPLFALDAQGRPYPTLARAMPEAVARGARVKLRAGLVTSRGRPLTAQDLRASLERSAKRAGGALLADVSALRAVPGDTLALEFVGADAEGLATRLSSPLLSVLPRNYSPLEPDGTGAFQARLARGELNLTRNVNAARGAAFLDAIEVRTVPDLSDALRAFEIGSVDVGWLGNGLHQPRAGAMPFLGGAYGFAVLRSGRRVRGWGAPGVAQKLVDAIAPERLHHLGLEGLPPRASESEGWGGGPAECLVADDAPQLRLIADSVANALSRPGNELRVAALPRNELVARRSTRDFALLVDFVRSAGPPGKMTQFALLCGENPELAKRPPKIDVYDARSIARGLSLGVIGELWVEGAHAPGFRGLVGWQLADSWRASET